MGHLRGRRSRGQRLVAALWSGGPGGFSPTPTWAMGELAGSYARGAEALAVGDFDWDGREDLAVGHPDAAGDGHVFVFFGTPSGLTGPDADADAVVDAVDLAPADPFACLDHDADGCDDCAVGGLSDPAGDGADADADGLCDPGDADDDGDGVDDLDDPAPLDPLVCGDADADGCDDCEECAPDTDEPPAGTTTPLDPVDAEPAKDEGCGCGTSGPGWLGLVGSALALARRRRT